MSEHTLPLWRVMELRKDTGNGYNIGLLEYPIFDDHYREPLNRKIIDHFWLREIGQETVSQFTFMLGRTMREQMPYFNQLYKSTQIQFDPLSTYNLTAVRNGTVDESTTQTTSSHNTSDTASRSRAVSSETPQTMLSGDEDYASSAADSNATSNVTGDGNGSASGTSETAANDTSTTTGYQGSAARLLNEYRNTLLNIDMNVIDVLENNFMMVWGSPPISRGPDLMGALNMYGYGRGWI